MSIPGSASPLFLATAAAAAAPAGYQIDRSLRFNDDDSAYLSRDFSAGNQKKFTFSAWLKKCKTSGNTTIFSAGSDGSNRSHILLNGTDHTLRYFNINSGSLNVNVASSALLRDHSAWYHIVIAADTTQSTSSDRIKIYLNGVEVDSFSSSTYPSQNDTLQQNAAVAHNIGKGISNAEHFDGYLAEVHFVDGQALAATDFGEEDSNGVWQPKEFGGTYAAKHEGGWVGDTTGTAFNNSKTADKAFDGLTSTSAAAASGGTLTFTPSTAITGITKVRIYAQRDSSASSATITLNGTDISSNWSNGDDKTVEITTDNLTSLAWTTQSNGQWFAVRRIEIYYSGAYYTLVPSNSFYLKFADNSSNAALGTDSSGNGNTWTVNNLTAGQFSPTATTTGDPTSSTDSPFSSGYSVDFDGDDAIRFTGPGTITGDFTVECFVKSSSYAGTQRIFSADQAAQSGERLNLRCYNGNTEFYVASGVSASGTNFPTNQWNHIAITRSGSTVSYYLNGSRWATDTHSSSFDVTTLVVAHGYGSEYFTGKVSNARFVDKQALYTGTSYTQPTSTLTTTSQGAKADNVRLICCHQSSVTATQGTVSGSSDIDSLLDTPTNYEAASGNNGGNYATLNPLESALTGLNNGNLNSGSSGAASWKICTSTLAVSSGKYYWEGFTDTTATSSIGWQWGFCNITPSDLTTPYGTGKWSYQNDSVYTQSSSGSTVGTSAGANDLLAYALDMDAGTCKLYVNNSLVHTFTGITGTVTPFVGSYNSAAMTVNFGQRPFAYTPPTGYVSLCTENLSESAYASIPDGSTAFEARTYNGVSGTSSQTGYNFGPDFVWIKRRNSTNNHTLTDIVRGAGRILFSQTTQAEVDNTAYFTGFTSDGYSFGLDGGDTDASGGSYVAWAWDAGSSTASNTDGSITSNVRVSQTNGFSIVTYTGTGSTATIGHGLNAAPGLIIIKSRTNVDGWPVYHQSFSNPANNYLTLNNNNGVGSITNYWNGTNSSVIGTLGGYAHSTNNQDYVAYCWAPVEGFSAFGKYVGQGGTTGPFVYTGFRPAFILYKESSVSGEHWHIRDTARDPINVTDKRLTPSTSNAEGSGTSFEIDILSNGFMLRAGNDTQNFNGSTYIYAAFAEHPFRTARAR